MNNNDDYMVVNRRIHRRAPREDNPNVQLENLKAIVYIFLVTCLMAAFILFILAYVTEIKEQSIMTVIKLGIVNTTVMLFRVSSSLFVISIVLGCIALTFRATSIWLVFCMLLFLISLTLVSGTASAFRAIRVPDGTEAPLKLGMTVYGNNVTDPKLFISKGYDDLQLNFKCCGVHSYKDWQSVDFGLTSLKVPRSCCIESRLGKSKIEGNCGVNMLPDHPQATKTIHTDGCLTKIIKELETILIVVGVLSLLICLYVVIASMFTCFFIITKRV